MQQKSAPAPLPSVPATAAAPAPAAAPAAAAAPVVAPQPASQPQNNSFINNLLLKTSPTVVNPGRIRLFVSFYTDPADKYHNTEIRDCLTRNANASFFDEVHVVCEDEETQTFVRANYPEAVKIHRVSARPTYKTMIGFADTDAQDGDINILGNADIIFTPSIILLRYIEMTNTVVCLQRWENDNDRVSIQVKNSSQDVWCWKNQFEDIDSFDFQIGLPSADNRLAYEIKSMGFNIINPCIDIVTIHSHKNKTREGSAGPGRSTNILPPYEYPTTCVLNFDKYRKRDTAPPFSFKHVLHIGGSTPDLSMQFTKMAKIYKHLPANDKTNLRVGEMITAFTPDFVFLNFDEPNILSTHTILRLRCMRAYIVCWSSRKLPHVDLNISSATFRPSFSKDIFNPVGPFTMDHPDIVILHPPSVPAQILTDLKTTYGPKILIEDKTTIPEIKQAEHYRSAKIAVAFDDTTAKLVDPRKEVVGCGALCLSQTATPDEIGDIRWSSISELRTLIDKYLKDDAERIRLARTACLRVHRYHTWINRVNELQQFANASPNTDLDLI
jgi:hypothetical protein